MAFKQQYRRDQEQPYEGGWHHDARPEDWGSYGSDLGYDTAPADDGYDGYDDGYGSYEPSAPVYSPEMARLDALERRIERENRWRLLWGIGDLVGVILGVAGILFLVAMLLILCNWVVNDMSEFLTLMRLAI